MTRRRALLGVLVGAAAGLTATAAFAQTISVDLGQGGITERALQLVALVTVLSLAPSILVMVTSFTRIVVVLSLLRTAIGTADGAAQRGDGQPGAVPDRLRHGADLAGRLSRPASRRCSPGRSAPSRRSTRRRSRSAPSCCKHVREKDLALFIDMAREARRAPTPEADRARDPDPGLHDLRAAARLRDRLPAVPAVPDHRPRGRLGPDVDGHDDAAAGRRCRCRSS